MVPTLTMLGRSWCPWSRDAGIAVAVATGVIMCRRRSTDGHPDPRCFGSTVHTADPVVDSPRPVRRPAAFHAVGGSSPRGDSTRCLTVLIGVGGRALPVRRAGRCTSAATTGRVGRTLTFVVGGLGAFFFATSSGLAAYDTTLLSVHMVQHMVLSMVVPLFLRARRAGHAGAAHPAARGRAGWLLAVLHSRVGEGAVLPAAHASLLFVISPWALYFSGWYDATLHSTFAARADARAPRAWSAACSSGRWWASTRCPGGSATRSGCCWSC